MRRAHANPDREFADRQLAAAMHAGGILDREARAGVGEDRFALLLRERRIGLVAQARHAAVIVMIPDPAFEAGEGAGPPGQQGRAQWRGLERLPGQAETRHLSRRRPGE
jgi:hypothetical protein